MSTRTEGSGPPNLMAAWTQWISGLSNAQGPAAQVYKEWETFFGAQFDKLSKSETFLGQLAKGLEGSFLVKSQFDRMLETSARAMRIPMAGDLEAVLQRLEALERRVESLAAAQARTTASEPAAAPKAARRPKGSSSAADEP